MGVGVATEVGVATLAGQTRELQLEHREDGLPVAVEHPAGDLERDR